MTDNIEDLKRKFKEAMQRADKAEEEKKLEKERADKAEQELAKINDTLKHLKWVIVFVHAFNLIEERKEIASWSCKRCFVSLQR
jgi:hypothetical protein